MNYSNNFWIDLRSEEGKNLFNKIKITNEKKISNPLGDILHCIKNTSDGYDSFGEAYFSFIHKKIIKGWKCHSRMILNLTVPIGEVVFYILKNSPIEKNQRGVYIKLGINSYSRLTIPPNHWFAFQGIKKENLVLNVANIKHNPNETKSIVTDQLFTKNIKKFLV